MRLDMSMNHELIAYDCPHCGAGFTIEAGDALFTDHVEDGCTETCVECGNPYQLRCVSVQIEMECTKPVGVEDEP